MNKKEKLELKEEIFNALIEYNSRINEDLENIRNGIITIKSAIITISNVLANATIAIPIIANSIVVIFINFLNLFIFLLIF